MTGASGRRASIRLQRIIAAPLAMAAMLLPIPAAGTAMAPNAGKAPNAATAARTICVGLVIDGTSIGGSRTTGCAKVKPGSSGIDVLEAAGHTVTTQYNGDFVCSIDGLPSSGCSGVDSSHYWAYWHRAAGASRWTYSSSGAGSYQPPAGSTDAWVYDDGSSRTPGSVGRLCPASAAPATKHSSAPSAPHPSNAAQPAATQHPAARSVNAHRTAPVSGAARAGRAGTGNAGVARAHATATSAKPDTARSRPAHRTRTAAGSTAETPTPAAVSSTPAAAASAPPESGGGNGFGLWLLVAAVIAAAGFGGAAWWRTRRSEP